MWKLIVLVRSCFKKTGRWYKSGQIMNDFTVGFLNLCIILGAFLFSMV